MRSVWFGLLFAAFCTALSVSPSAPADGALVTALSVNFTFALDGNATSCALYSNASGWSAVQSGSNVTSFAYAYPADGQYLWSVGCTYANGTFFSANRTLRIDSTPPPTPSGLSAAGTSPANLSWNASSDASVVTYELFRNATLVYNGTGLTFSENVPAATMYNYSVRAVDAAGLASPYSAPLSVSGPAASVAITNLAVTTTSSTAAFSWTATPAANASVSYGNASVVLGVVSNLASSTSASLAIAGLSPATTYSYNATACAATCTNVSGMFRTQPSSYPVPALVSVNGSLASSTVRFSAFWSDSLALSHYVFSTNLSGSWANATYAFNGSYSNHTLVLPSSVVTFAWQFLANNSQAAWNATALQYLTVTLPAATATPVPTATATATPAPTVAATAIPTIPPELLRPTATPEPTPPPSTAAPETTPVSAAATPAPAAIAPTLAGLMGDLVLDALQADFSLSPTGLVIGVNAPAANVSLSSNFTNQGDEVAVQLVAELNGTTSLQLFSQPATVQSSSVLLLQTLPRAVAPGDYDVTGRVVALESGQVLSEKTLRLHVASRYIPDTPALSGFLVVLLAAAALLGGQLQSVRKEFA